MKNAAVVVSACVLVALFAACSGEPDPTATPTEVARGWGQSPLPLLDATTRSALQDEVDKNRKLWISIRPYAYSFEYQYRSFLSPEYIAPVRISVEDGRVSNVVFTEPTKVLGNDWGSSAGSEYPAFKPLPADVQGRYMTIDQLFNDIREDIHFSDNVQVEYDPDTGYPIHVSVDPYFNTIDDEYSYRVTSILVARGWGRPPLPLLDAATRSALQDEVDKNRKLWISIRPYAYSFEYQYRSFLPPEYIAPVRISVEDGRVSNVVFTEPTKVLGNDWGSYADSEYPAFKPLPASVQGRYTTIDQLFNDIKKDINFSDNVQVEYDPDTGYPIHVSVDPYFNTIDDEYSYSLTHYQPGVDTG